MNTTRVHRIFVDFEREERWLNDMAARGLALVRYTWGTYHFDVCAPGEWTYRIQLLDADAHAAASTEYLGLAAQAGAEAVTTYRNWVYFRRRSADGPFELFSDLDSRLAHYRRVLAPYVVITVVLSVLMATSVSRLVMSLEEWVGEFAGLPLFVLYMTLIAVFFIETVRLSRRIRELEGRRRIEE